MLENFFMYIITLYIITDTTVMFVFHDMGMVHKHDNKNQTVFLYGLYF